MPDTLRDRLYSTEAIVLARRNLGEADRIYDVFSVRSGRKSIIAKGARKRIDLGYIDHDYFANAAAMGMSPLIAETVPHKLKKYLGMIGYLIWAIRVAFKFRPFRLLRRLSQSNRRKRPVIASPAPRGQT